MKEMDRKVYIGFFLAITLFCSVVTAQTGQDLSGLVIPDGELPDSWSTATSQVMEENDETRLYQILSSPKTEMEITYLVVHDPESKLFNKINSDIAISKTSEAGEEVVSYFETIAKDIEVGSGEVVSAKLQRIKEDDPNFQFDVTRMIRMFTHYRDYTFIVYADSWMFLESAGEPNELIEGIFTAGLGTAQEFFREEGFKINIFVIGILLIVMVALVYLFLSKRKKRIQ
jgi:hypothetical protein